MHPMNLLIAEQGADWTHWHATKHLVGPGMLVLVQQADETLAAFRTRIRTRTARLKTEINDVVLLRGGSDSELTTEVLLEDLALRPRDVRSYPATPRAYPNLAPAALLPARVSIAPQQAA
jgi:hypothetical protein